VVVGCFEGAELYPGVEKRGIGEYGFKEIGIYGNKEIKELVKRKAKRE